MKFAINYRFRSLRFEDGKGSSQWAKAFRELDNPKRAKYIPSQRQPTQIGISYITQYPKIYDVLKGYKLLNKRSLGAVTEKSPLYHDPYPDVTVLSIPTTPTDDTPAPTSPDPNLSTLITERLNAINACQQPVSLRPQDDAGDGTDDGTVNHRRTLIGYEELRHDLADEGNTAVDGEEADATVSVPYVCSILTANITVCFCVYIECIVPRR